MHKPNYFALLYLVIFIEGYVVLSSEILAMRQISPFIGTGTDIISIILASFLLPLAVGYDTGGKFKPQKIFGYFITVRKKILINFVIAASLMTFGLSYRLLFTFFYKVFSLEIYNRILATSIYSALFVIIPIYLLGQTVPLISRYFHQHQNAKTTGKILFISTLGSVSGAIFPPLFLMYFLGAHHATTLNFLLLTCLTVLLSKRLLSWSVFLMVCLFTFNIIINSNYMLLSLAVKKNNRYGTIATRHENGYNYLRINHNQDSKYNPDTKRKHDYIEFAERIAIHPIMTNNDPAREILIIGAGGFTFGHEDKKNKYTFVDIDSDLQGIAERYILKEPIGENKKFVPQEARAFLRSNDKKFDVIYLDAYLGGLSIPEQLVTKEFYTQVYDTLNDKGVLVINMIVSPNFSNTFTRSLDNTILSVFPNISRVAINDTYVVWNEKENIAGNVAYIYKKNEGDNTKEIYTDTQNHRISE